MKAERKAFLTNLGIRVGVCTLVLGAGIALKTGLAAMKKPPAHAVVSERVLFVEAREVHPEDVPVTITGFGEVRPLNVVPVAAEIPGAIVETHPRLDAGEIIPKGDVLFRIDPRDYLSAKAQAEAQVQQWENTVARLEKQFRIDQDRLKTLERSAELMRADLERVRALLEQDEVGTQSGVDKTEMSYNQAIDARDQLDQQVTLYPTRIQEARAATEAARAQLAIASVNLERTEVRAPFDARIKMKNIERGQYVRPGEPALVLADDSVLELSVPLDSRDAQSWLRFAAPASTAEGSWFGVLEPVECRIVWTEAPDAHAWTGTLHRVERFDQQTRTVTVAIRVESKDILSKGNGIPLVDGMFCAVRIPGKVMTRVYRLPRWAVSFEGKVNVAENDRLQIREVTVLRTEGDDTFVTGGIEPGDTVITTRLQDPLPNSLLNVVLRNGSAESAS